MLTTPTTTRPITLPLVHARGVIKIHGGLGALGEIIFVWARRMGRDLTLGVFDSCLRIKVMAV